jgi:hypothetical protein
LEGYSSGTEGPISVVHARRRVWIPTASKQPVNGNLDLDEIRASWSYNAARGTLLQDSFAVIDI